MDRFTGYIRKHLPTGTLEALLFTAEDYNTVGVSFARLGGLPTLEAYQLINYWNATKQGDRFMYWLA
jgi:hypothetical protein